MSASRALGRWAFRLLRREWRQQLLVLSLITISLAVVSLGSTLLTNATTPRSRIGSANYVFRLSGGAEPFVERVKHVTNSLTSVDSNTRVEATYLRRAARTEQSNTRFELSDARFKNAFGGEPLLLTHGRKPSVGGEIAMTGELLRASKLHIGSTIKIKTVAYEVVGEIEDPNSLRRRLATTAPGFVASPTEAELLVRTSDAWQQTRTDIFSFGIVGVEKTSMGENERQTSQILSVVLSAVAMLEVSLLCSAGFGVLANRRKREFALLAAVGARARYLKRAVIMNGAFVGIVGGFLGVFTGFGVSLLLQPWLERWIGVRLGLFAIPWATLLPFVLVAVLASIGASWWPARSVARASIMSSVKAARPNVRSTQRSLLIGLTMLVVGAVALRYFIRTHKTFPAGLAFVSSALGILLLAPSMISSLGKYGPSLPLSIRIATRNLSRNRSRSSIALAALVVALGGAVSVVVVAVSVGAQNNAIEPAVPRDMALLAPTSFGNLGNIPKNPASMTAALASIDGVKRAIPESSVVAIYAAAYPTGTPEPDITWAAGPQRHVVRVEGVFSQSNNPDGSLNRRSGTGEDVAWIATPELLSIWKLDPKLAQSSAGLLGPRRVRPVINDNPADRFRGSTPVVATLGRFGNAQVPMFWIPQARVALAHYEPVLMGWVLRSPNPLTVDQIDAIAAAASDELSVSVTDLPSSMAPARNIALAVGSLLGFTILAVVLSLLRSESTDEDHAFVAIGANRKMRRAVSAAAAGILAFEAGVLSIPAGALALVGMYTALDGVQGIVVPLDALGVVLVAFPLVSAFGAWMFTRATPRSLPRRM